MTHISSQGIGSILDHVSDVIEGGTVYGGGRENYTGIPGRGSWSPGLVSGDDTPLDADGAGDDTTINVASTYSWPESRWVKEHSPPFFLLCTAGETLAVGKARRITAWDNTTKNFSTDAFPVAPGAGASFDVLEGFRRVPDTIDINADTNSSGGYDRHFAVSLDSGVPIDWYGDGTRTYRGSIDITLRLLKYKRHHAWKASVAENLVILAQGLTQTGEIDHRNDRYIRAILQPDEEPEIIIDDEIKIVATLALPLIYRVQRGF